MSDVYFDTFKEADVELLFDYTNEGELLAVAITINHPMDDIGEEFKLEVVGYWYAPDIDEAFKRLTRSFSSA